MADRLSAQEAADYLRLSRAAVYAGIARGDIPASKFMGRITVEQEDLDNLLARHSVKAKPHRDPMPQPKRQSSNRFRSKVVELREAS